MVDKLVSIITINYNGWKDTCEMIASLKEYERYPYEVIVVDNASEGNDADLIEKAFPDVKVIRSDYNLGFAGGNNLGYQYAEGEYIFFLNNDTVVHQPVLQVMVQCFEDKSVGGVSPMIRFFHSPDQVQYYGYEKMSHITLKHTTPAYNPAYPEQYLIGREVDVMHGAAMMVPRCVIEQVGLIAGCYFLYFEEFDWSNNIQENGFKIWYEPAAIIYHKEGTKKGYGLTPFRAYYIERSRVLFARRTLKGFDRFLSCCYLLGVVLVRDVLKYILQGRWKMVKAVISGAFSGLTTVKKL